MKNITDMTTKKVFIFDLDNTLVNSDEAYRTALKAININNDTYEKARAYVKSTLNKERVMPQSRNRLLYFKEYLLLETGQCSPVDIINLLEKYESSLFQSFHQQWHDLKRDQLFNGLARKHNLYILTNENLKTQLVKLSAIDPHGIYFNGILTSEEFGFEKPELGLFKHLLNKYNIDTHSATMIGDSYENDIKPALQLGLKVAQTIEFTKAKVTQGHKVIDNLNSICDF